MPTGYTYRKMQPGEWFRYHFLEKKLNTRFGYFFFLALALLVACGTVLNNMYTGPYLIALLGALLMMLVMLKETRFGIYVMIAFSSLTILIDRFLAPHIPSGNFVELLTCAALGSLLIHHKLRKKAVVRRFWTHPITIALFSLFFYYLIEFFNPHMQNDLGWLSFFKKQLSYFLFYFLCYCLLDSRARMIFFVRFMIGLSTILALYACKQQWFGYAGFELRAIGTGYGYQLLYQGGMLRKFSVLSDPASSGILFAAVSILSLILLYRNRDRRSRIWLGAALVINLLGYSFSGTRTATMMIIAALIFYCIVVIYEKRTRNFLIGALVSFFILITLPFRTAVTDRIKTTFEGTKDASAAVRDFNRNEVRPYIQAHPMGGGIFTSGVEGHKYNPGHYLEYFQPDSGYMKTIAEQGVFGIASFIVFYFTIMRTGLRYVYRIRDPEMADYYLGLVVMLFSLMVAQYSQMAVTQYPLVLYFYGALALLIKMPDYTYRLPFKTGEADSTGSY